MRTILKLEETIEDTPQTRALVRLVEGDVKGLHHFVTNVENCARKLISTHKFMTQAMNEMAECLAKQAEKSFALEPSDIDANEILERVARNISDLASSYEMVDQQLDGTLLIPISRLQRDLQTTNVTASRAYKEADNQYKSSLEKFSRLSPNDSLTKIQSIGAQYRGCQAKFHMAAMSYYSRLNSTQFTRYTNLLEPLMSMVYSLRSGHAQASQTLNDVSAFVTTQEHMKRMHDERAKVNKDDLNYLKSMAMLIEHQNTQDLEQDELDDQAKVIDRSKVNTSKQSYVFMKNRSGILTRWCRKYMFIQGSHLMIQDPDDVAGRSLVDLSQDGTHAVCNNSEDRRFTFNVICTDETKTQNIVYTIQANNHPDKWHWLTVINKVANYNSSPVTSPNTLRHAKSPMVETASNVSPQKSTNFKISFKLPSTTLKSCNSTDDVDSKFEGKFFGCVTVREDGEDSVAKKAISQVIEAGKEANATPHDVIVTVTSSKLIISSGDDKSIYHIVNVTHCWSLDESVCAIICADGDATSEFTCCVFEIKAKAREMCATLESATNAAFEKLVNGATLGTEVNSDDTHNAKSE